MIDTPIHTSGSSTPALDAIRSRRSIRAFLPDAVPQAVIEQTLEAAARAPSGAPVSFALCPRACSH
ncbi:nitroreductase family protein [Alcaligenaceae bacterium]|nr:nitroreductase family protein [Alcaligenaceae bacterium]